MAAIEVRGRTSFQGPGLLAAASTQCCLSAAPLLAWRNVSLPRSGAPLPLYLLRAAAAAPTTTKPRLRPHAIQGRPLIQGIAFTMLLLDYQNVLIQSVLTERFSG